MLMKRVEIDVPETITKYVVVQDADSARTRDAMMLYPYIKNNVISHGKAAELLGMHKLDLIRLYSDMGLAYLDMTEEEFDEEMKTVKELAGMIA